MENTTNTTNKINTYEIFAWDKEAVSCRPCQKSKEIALKIKEHDKNANIVIVEYDRNSEMIKLKRKLNTDLIETLPVIFRNDELIGGFDDFKKHYHKVIDAGWMQKLVSILR